MPRFSKLQSIIVIEGQFVPLLDGEVFMASDMNIELQLECMMPPEEDVPFWGWMDSSNEIQTELPSCVVSFV